MRGMHQATGVGWLAVSVLYWACSTVLSQAHEVRPAYLELKQTSEDSFDVLWKVPALGDNLRLGLYVRFPESCVIESEPAAMFVNEAYLERSRIREPSALVGSTIHVDGLKTTMTDVLVRIERLDGTTQVERLLPEQPSFVVQASPSRWRVAWTYLVLGFEHILLGIDHLLFVLALVLLVKGWRRIVETITSFTVAHSITLALATLGYVHVPGPPVEACIALSIVFVSAEIIRSRQGYPGLTEQMPWLISFTFGLLHGLGFAGALSDVGLPQQAIPLALLFFNVGVELGQLVFVVAVIAVAAALRRVPWAWPAWTWRIVPYCTGALAMFWVIQRTSVFR